MSTDKKGSGLSDIDQFEKSEWGLSINQVTDANKTKGFVRVKPSDIKTTLSNQFQEGKPMGDTTGILKLDDHFRWRKKGGVYGISAYPQAGKSELIKFLLVNKSRLYKTKSVIFSPEEDTEDIIEDLARVYLRQNTNKRFKNQCTIQDWNKALDWIEETFVLLEFDGMVDFKSLMAEFELLAKQGYKDFVVDPWNYVAEGAMDRNNNFEFLKTGLSHMKTFSKRYKSHNIIVEHQNIQRVLSDGSYPKANIRNITGGSMWGNKLDAIIILHNNWTVESKDISVEVEIAKSKNQRYNGQRGSVTLYFDIETGHYLELDPRSSQEVIDYSESQNSDDDKDDIPF